MDRAPRHAHFQGGRPWAQATHPGSCHSLRRQQRRWGCRSFPGERPPLSACSCYCLAALLLCHWSEKGRVPLTGVADKCAPLCRAPGVTDSPGWFRAEKPCESALGPRELNHMETRGVWEIEDRGQGGCHNSGPGKGRGQILRPLAKKLVGYQPTSGADRTGPPIRAPSHGHGTVEAPVVSPAHPPRLCFC